jgi:membrane-bound serine protease (ClpP class)
MRNPSMRRRLIVATTLLLAAGAVAGILGAAASAQSAGPTVLHLTLDGVVDPFVADYIRGAIADAGEGDTAAVLLTMDTPGGLDSSMREIVQAILNADVPVICYVSPQGARAASAGAFILTACPIAAMAPGTNVGAATPVGVSGLVLSRKVTEDAVAYIRSLAEQRGRNPDLVESFVREAKSVSAEEALDADAIDLIEPSTASLLAAVDGTTVTVGGGNEVTLHTIGAPIEDRNLSGVVAFLHTLFDPNLAFIFFWLGLALIVLELIVPGHIFSGTLGTIMLVLSVASFGLLPVRLVGILLLVASVVFFLLEIKVPGLGAWSVAGIVTLLLGGEFLFNGAGGVHVSPLVTLPVAAAVAAFFGLAVAKLLEIRHKPPAQGPERFIGMRGVALEGGLSPEGVVRVAAEEWNATSARGPVPAGAKVKVTALDGLRLTVEPADEDDNAPALPEEGGNR